MNATFVELSPDELAEFVQDPAQLERLFHGQPAGSVGLLWDDAARERLERMSPQLLASATQGLPPDLQEEIAKRLGVVREALGSEDGGKARSEERRVGKE